MSSNKFKILFVLPNLFGGGAERVFTYLVNHIDRERFDPHLALGAKRGAYLQDIKKDVPIYKLKGERARSAIPSLIKLVRELKPDTVISTLGMNFANLSAKAFYPSGTRVVLREGNSVTAFLEDVARNSPVVSTFYRRSYRLLYNRADAIICQSDFMLRDIVENLGIHEENLFRIHNPVDFDNIDRLLAEKTGSLYPDDAFNFIAVGKLYYHKGFDILLKAFAEAKKKEKRITLTILGKGVERENLESLINKLGLEKNVRMLGFVENPYVHVKQADAFVSSSRYEGFANVIVESLACETPVVATDCPSANREVIIEGENGWFAEVENVDSLAETLLKATREAKFLDRQKIREVCKERFSIKQILPHYEQFLANRKIKILFVLPTLFGGGAERVFTHLVNNIDRKKFEPHLALGARSGAYLGDIEDDVPIHLLNGIRARTAIPSLIKLVRKLNPDTVFSTLGMNFANLLGKAFYSNKTRVVLREGSSVTAFLDDIARESPGRAAVYHNVYSLVYNRADAIICQSDFMLRDIAENLGVGEANLHRIYNPVDFEKIDRLLEEEIENIFSKDTFNFVTAGTLSYVKGYDILLKAFAKAREKDKNIKLLILGEGEERDSLEKLRTELNLEDSVKMIGFVKNPYAYISQADVFVSSSRYEGFANVIVESLACKTPVIATDCPSSNPEVITEGENGWFAEVENADSLAETLLRAKREVKHLDGQKIREDCKARFSIYRILPEYEKLLKV